MDLQSTGLPGFNLNKKLPKKRSQQVCPVKIGRARPSQNETKATECVKN